LSAINIPYWKRHIQNESERMENKHQASRSQKQAEVATLLCDKVELKPNLVRRDKSHDRIIKGSIHQEDIIIVNIYAPNPISEKKHHWT
jgi:hypothetical protein